MTQLKELQLAGANLPIGSLDAYIQHANRIPMLSQEEEYQLASALFHQGDVTAAKQLILPHLRYVIKVARSYLGYGLPLADLIQEGNMGLMKAVKRFNPEKGARLVTFAMHWIKAEIHEYILRNWRIVKVATTKAQRKLFFNLRSMKKRLSWMTQAETEDIANDLGVKPETVREMELRMTASDAAFDGYDDSDDSASFAPAGYLEDHSLNPAGLLEHSNWSDQSGDALQNALSQLDERSLDIIQNRWLAEDKLTLQDLADKYQVSAERVRQLEKNAMKKLRTAISAEMQ